MIRHLTSEEKYKSICNDGVIKVRRSEGRDKGVISFEKLNGNDVFVNIFREGKINIGKEQVIVGLLVDEEKLKNENFKVHYTDSRTEESRRKSKYTTKYENITRFNGETSDDYIKIGEYIHVEGEIPTKYIEQYVFYKT